MSSYPLLDLFLTMLWLFIWILWIFLLVRIIMDIFRSHDLGGWAKAGWLTLVVLLPFLGVLIYLIARGGNMSSREYGLARAHDQVFDANLRATSDRDGRTDELTRLAELRDRGVLNDEEFQQGKARILG